MRVLFLGSGAFACPTLRWIAESEHEVPLVITQPARGAGRGRHKTRTPVAAIAEQLGLKVAEADNVNEPSFVDRVRSTGAQLGVVIAFGQKLGPALLEALPEGFVNLHASLLPLYRGAAPINWAILRGEEKTGCTVFRIVEKMDAGPILSSRWTYIKPEETAGELHDRLAGIGVDATQAALESFANDASPPGEPQDHTLATTAPKLKKSDGVIDWHRPAPDVVNHILGMTPWPSATTRYASHDGRWEDVSIIRARLTEASDIPADSRTESNPDAPGGRAGGELAYEPRAQASGPTEPRPSGSGSKNGEWRMANGEGDATTNEPRTSVRADEQDAYEPQAQASGPTHPPSRRTTRPTPGAIDARRFVATANGVVEILEIKPSSGRIMTWPEYVNGRHVSAGDRFD